MGAVIAALSLLLTVLVFDGVDMLPALSRDVPGVPAEIPTIFASLDTWAKIVAVTTVMGGALFAFTFVKYGKVQDEAVALQAIFDRLEATGSLPLPLAMSFPNAGFSFLFVLLGTALIAGGGVLGLVSRRRSVTPAPTP